MGGHYLSYKRMSTGPKTDPFGTPEETGMALDMKPFRTTDWSLLSAYVLTADSIFTVCEFRI